MNLIDFLLEMLNLDMQLATTPQKRAEVRFKRKIVDLTQSWPVLLEGPVKLTHTVAEESLSTVAMEMTRQYQFVLASEYRKIFGDEPPTSPLLMEMAQIYSDHPSFKPEWKLKEN